MGKHFVVSGYTVIVLTAGIVLPIPEERSKPNTIQGAKAAVSFFLPSISNCRASQYPSLDVAANAIVIAEQWFRGSVETHFENVLFSILPSLVEYFDISIGPAQLKISTAAKITGQNIIQLKHLNELCPSRDIVSKFLFDNIGQNDVSVHIYKLAIEYNGGDNSKLQTHLYARFIANIFHIQNLKNI